VLTEALKTSGWKSLKKGTVEFCRCPCCKGLTQKEMLLGFSEAGATCFQCDQVSPWEQFEAAQREETIATCAACGREMPLTDYCLSFVGYLCTCNNYIAIPFEGEFVQPHEILQLGWNEHLQDRGMRISVGCFAATCETPRDRQVLTILQTLAKEHNPEFKFADEKNRALLAFDPTGETYIGYLLWYEKKEYAILNQLFVMSDHRRRGNASAIVTHWVENYADKIADKFALESPNSHALEVHEKLGHIRREGEHFVGVRCVFFSGGV
jgi:GNAT superfamily N-acetyltransferase